MSEHDHYNATTGQFTERRQPTPWDNAVLELRNDFKEHRASVREDLSDMSRLVEVQTKHVDAIMHQMQDNFTRQLNQNTIEHRDMMEVFKAELANQRELQRVTLDQMAITVGCHDTDIRGLKDAVEKLQNGKQKHKADNWDNFKAALVGAAIMLVVSGGVWVMNGIQYYVNKQMIPAVAPKQETNNVLPSAKK